ncbi:DUF6879 family protein [Amycolatopsis methanolica]|uniref:DUF6879 domain-containing protein n=1 Tax=Amycolatopsis methanolica 239 TaxID=1068978 RepID=A0A076N8E2_AMYME|nr:DUF6879 family protein [Amycolatopsis methanolica]AIJ26342.1 hypothetical protein AMETH_6250 [Amycolatopsis methanolica 239]AIJ26401.1 hypothetical protein AMETH_6309 [Amycolatopsis methanolica 239]
MTWVNRGEEFAALFTGFRHSMWRWECQGTYHEPGEREPFRQWQEGRPYNGFLDRWLARVRQFRSEGKTLERVRMVTEPPTEYLRWMFTVTPLNVAAGEDIRWISESDARALGEMPEHDFYLFDDARVAIMRFDENGVLGAEVTEDPRVVADHRRWRDRVWSVATAHAESQYATARSP